MPTPTLLTPYALTQLAGEPHTLIRLLNLQTVLPVGTDAWGRPNIPQPVLISACISLAEPFASASSGDRVTGSTVHYGVLSKAILGACGKFGGKEDGGEEERSLYTLVMYLQAFITGVVSSLQEGEEGAGGMRLLEVEAMLPKASLLGSGVSMKGSFVYDNNRSEKAKKGPIAHSMALRLHKLRIPTIIGVNPNERLAKQTVVASIDIERWDQITDEYYELENLVVKTISESSFETLEALTSQLSREITKHFIEQNYDLPAIRGVLAGSGTPNFPKIRIALAKPTAVMFADAPVVEVLLETEPSKSDAIRGLWQEILSKIIHKHLDEDN